MKIYFQILLLSLIPLMGFAQGPVGPVGPQSVPLSPTEEKTSIDLPYKPEPEATKPDVIVAPKPSIQDIMIPYIQAKAPKLEKAPDPR